MIEALSPCVQWAVSFRRCQQPPTKSRYTTSFFPDSSSKKSKPKMSIPHSSLQKIPLSYASCSIGCSPNDTLPHRLQAIGEAGFSAIELSFPDILDFGAQITGKPIAANDYAAIMPVAAEIRKLCEEHGLKIMMLQPFANFEGWVKGSIDREEAFARATGWMEIMNVVGTDMLQVCVTVTCISAAQQENLESSKLIPLPGRSNRHTRALNQERTRCHHLRLARIVRNPRKT